MTEDEYREASAKHEKEMLQIRKKMQPLVSGQLRDKLEEALQEDDQELAKEWLLMALRYDAPIEEMTDLHFKLMLLLALPKRATKEKRGRPEEERTRMRNWMLQLACMAKAEILGWSFTKTWKWHVGRGRPNKPTEELWRAAGILYDLTKKGEEGNKDALFAAHTFQISNIELLKIAEKYCPNSRCHADKDGGVG